MTKLSLVVLIFFAFVCMTSAKWLQSHEYTPSVSAQIADAIKAKLLSTTFPDPTFDSAFKADLNNKDDKKRTVTSITPANAKILFAALNLNDPGCDANGDGSISGDELKCLNYAWKSFIPS